MSRELRGDRVRFNRNVCQECGGRLQAGFCPECDGHVFKLKRRGASGVECGIM